MDFIRYLWVRAEEFTKFTVIVLTASVALAIIALTYESKILYFISQTICWGYVAYVFGYHIVYMTLKDKYNKFRKEQEELFINIKDPK
jgi:hypothetical protein